MEENNIKNYNNYKLNFLACAIKKKYEDMILPFLFFSLYTNKDCHVEIVVENPELFKKKYNNELNECSKIIGNNFLIRSYQYKFNKNIPNTYRFFEVPIINAEYTYIVDIDIMFLENILDNYLKNWHNNLVYNNILRIKDKVRLTGVHLVNTEKYYTNEFKNIQLLKYNENTNRNDEVILGEMCEKIHGLPLFDHRYRPILGVHFSPNRGNNKKLKLITTKNYYNKFIEIRLQNIELFKFKIFDDLYKSLINDFVIK